MGDSSDLDPPAKRVRYTQHHQEPSWHGERTTVTMPVTMASATVTPVDSMPVPFTTAAPALDDTWPLIPSSPANSAMFHAAAPCCPAPTVSWAIPAPQPAGRDLELSPTAPVPLPLPSHQHPPPNRHQRALLPAGSDKTPDSESSSSSTSPTPSTLESKKCNGQLLGPLKSPFNDCHERLGPAEQPKYGRPNDGRVNGYVKFNWPSAEARAHRIAAIEASANGLVHYAGSMGIISRSSSITSLIGPTPANSIVLSPVNSEGSWEIVSTKVTADTTLMSPEFGVPVQYVSNNDPQMLPPHFGFHAKMDWMDRRLWEFYIKNWCPGRSVLNNTNLWLTDFAKMHDNEGIRCAIQSLAGVYIHDYLPDERIRARINERYALADAHFSRLLVDPRSSEVGKGQEVITMAVILSMQDIVLTERRRKKPHKPRWLEGFKQGEYFLHMTDAGSRFWCENNVQLPSLRVSQSIIVGRAVILAQPMMPLPAASTLNPQLEASRFGWLLYGTEQDMYEIHGGCGFSKKLLHVLSQITYCAARLQQERKSAIVPITAKFLLKELTEMRQWSSESIPWNEALQKPQTIEWVKTMPEEHIIDTNGAMTDVTAEAWRIAAIIYLQCRVLRLPRSHPEVLANLADLAKCIRIMPTSGSHFTAQAPLLPVFLLGLLATVPDHKEVSQQWFEQVVKTPVRSSVPPLYQALMRIWDWIDGEVPLPSEPTVLSEHIGERRPWWERLVAKVQHKEEETLCLT